MYTVTITTTGKRLPRPPGPLPSVQYASAEQMAEAMKQAAAGYARGPSLCTFRECRTCLGARWYALRRMVFRRGVTAKIRKGGVLDPVLRIGYFADGDPFTMRSLRPGAGWTSYLQLGLAYGMHRDESFRSYSARDSLPEED